MKCANCYDTVAAMLAAKDKVIAEVTADRDEWKYQHELLLGVRNADLAALRAKLTSQVASGEAVEPEVVVDTGDGVFYSTHTVHAQIIKGQWKVQVKIGQEKQPPTTNEFVAEGCELFTTPSPSNVLVEALRNFTNASMRMSTGKGETYIGWQKEDGLRASERVEIARKALATYSPSTDSVSVIENPDSFRCIRANNGYLVDDVVMVNCKELILNLTNGQYIDKTFYDCFVPHLVRKSS